MATHAVPDNHQRCSHVCSVDVVVDVVIVIVVVVVVVVVVDDDRSVVTA